MKYWPLALVAFLFLANSCTNVKEKHLTNISSTKELKGIRLKVKPGKVVFIVDTLIILSLAEPDTCLFAVYGLNSNKYLGSIITRGKKGGKFSDVLFYGQSKKSKNGVSIWLADFNTKEISLINVTTTIQDQNIHLERRETFAHNKITNPVFLFPIPDNSITGFQKLLAKNEEDERVFSFNPSNKQIAFKSTHKINLPSDINDVFADIAYSGYAKIKPDGSQIAYARKLTPTINISNATGDLSVVYFLSEESPTRFDKETLEKGKYKIYNSWIDVTDGYIYVLRRNDMLKDMRNSNKPRLICKIDWQGNLTENFKISDRITNFAVDEKNNVIYGLSHIDQILYKYTL